MIPKNPITIAINKAITESAINNFVERYLPAYDWNMTSFYRSPEKNRDIGGAPDSAHQYGLAQDGVLVHRVTGEIVSDSKMKQIYDEYIKPHWKGWSQFKFKQPNTSTGWIHLNLDRGISKYSAWGGAAALAGLGAFLFNRYRKQLMKARA